MPSVSPDQTSELRTRGRRALILQAAAHLFATNGYAGTTIRDIAGAADLTSGSLYHHFVSKEEMLAEILRGFLEDLTTRFERIERRAGGPDEVLRGLVQDAFFTVHQTPDAVALYQREAAGLTGRPDFAFVAESTARLEQVIRRTLVAGQAAGVFRGDLDVGLTYRLIRDTVWSTVHWYRSSGPATPAELAERYLRVLLGGITADA